MSLVIDGLKKRFGEVQALDGVSLTVPDGQVFGFLGANGAGKTTTMRIVLGLLKPDSGTVTTWGGDLMLPVASSARAKGTGTTGRTAHPVRRPEPRTRDRASLAPAERGLRIAPMMSG